MPGKRVDLEVVLSAVRAIQSSPDLWRLNELASDVEELVSEVERLRKIERAAQDVYRVLHEETRDDIDFTELGAALNEEAQA